MTKSPFAWMLMLCGAALLALCWSLTPRGELGATTVTPAGAAPEAGRRVVAERVPVPLAEPPARLPIAAPTAVLPRAVTGRVVDGSGVPLPGALVVVEVRGVAEGPRVTDAQGRFAVPAVIPEGVAARVAASCAGHCPAVVVIHGSAADAHIVVPDLVLGLGGTLVGRLAERNGNPVPAARVAVRATGHRTAWDVDSDALGRFRISLLPCAPLSVVVSAPAWQRCVVSALAPLGAGEVRDLGTLVLVPGRTIQGLVRTVDGAVARDAEVTCLEADAAVHADGDGRFTLDSLPAGTVRLRARADGFLDCVQPCDATVSTATLVLMPGATVRGTLWTEGTGERIADGQVALVQLGELARPVPAAAAWGSLVPHALLAAADGRFVGTGLAPGHWALCATAPRHAATWVGPITVRAETGRIEQDVFLAPGWTLAGEVRSAAGAPLVDATVQLLEPLPPEVAGPVGSVGDRFLRALDATRADAEARWVAACRTDAAGRFAFADVPRRALRVVARAEGFAPGSALVMPGAATGMGTETVLRLLPCASVHGVVLGLAPGDRGVQVVLVAGAGRCRAVDVGARGEYRFDRVDPGRYLLRAVRGPAERGLHDLMARIRAGDPDLVTPDLELVAGQAVQRDVAVLEPRAAR